mgnify:CR=1 FL=1|jgi:hypothetical protein
MAKRQKTTRFSVQSYDLEHYRQTESYARAIDALFDRATKEISTAAAKGKYDPDKPFSFDDYPSVKAVMQEVTKQLASRMITTIETGSKKQWLFACDKNDGFISSIMDTSKLSKSLLKKMQDRNLEALQAFQERKIDGMNLSQRVWKYVGQYKEQLESALDVGLGDGRSAQQLARDVKQNLNEPNRLFRRVRDKRGNLVLSKAARAFHPGRGVYRSSVKNAQRLTRSEINMAYRESDWQRWQSLDFVVGFEIRRSNHEPLCDCDLCEKLVGRYPKTFKFKGWHPQCMCYAVPILMDEETFDENELGDLKAALHGTTYKKMQAKNIVVDVPDGFKQWVKDHVEAQANWASTPYFIKDNFKDGQLSKGLNIALPTVKKAIIELFKGSTPQEIKDFIIQNIAKSCTLEIKLSDIDLWNDIVNQLNNRIKQFGLEKFGNIGTPRSRNAEASWDEHGNILNLNITALRNKTAIKKAMSYKKRGILYSFAYEDSDDYVRAVIDHELGHLILSKYANVSEVAKLMGDVGKSIMVNGKSFNPINDILGYYASTEEHEFFAEAFSFYMGKNREKLDDRIKGYFERLFSKHGFNIDGDIEPPIDPIQQQLDALKPQITMMRQGCLKWGLSLQLSMLDKYVQDRDIAHIQSRLATIQSKVAELEQKDSSIRAKCQEWGLNTFILDDAMKNPDSIKILQAMNELEERVKNAEKEYKTYIQDAQEAVRNAKKANVDSYDVEFDISTITADKREWVMGKTNIKKRLSDLQKAINDASGTSIHPAMKTSYIYNSDVDDTLKRINKEFTTERWFEHGDCALTPTRKSGVNGFTYMDGRISLRPERLEHVKSAMAKIGQGRSNEITFEEADAMATFWHEIAHNRNIPGNMYMTNTQTDVMEMMNEFVARKTLPEFYAKMGCPSTPHPEFINDRGSTGYNRRVIGYDFVIKKLGLNPDKVLASARKNLFELKYTEQETTAIQALLDGGLDKFKGVNGKKLGKAQIKKIVAMCRNGYGTQTIENYMKEQGIIAKE